MGYSIVIRTLGKAGEKYQTMLRCIDRLNDKPDEVLVVIPKGMAKVGWIKRLLLEARL